MAKRKRDDDAAASTEDVKRRVSQTVVSGIAKLKQSLETAQRFERQKLGRREQERKSAGDGRSIQVEVASLKSLDLEQIARSHIHKNLVKTPSIAKTGLLPDGVRLPAPSKLDKVTLDILARLFKQRRVAEVVEDTTRMVRKQIGLSKPDEPAAKKIAKSREVATSQGIQRENGRIGDDKGDKSTERSRNSLDALVRMQTSSKNMEDGEKPGPGLVSKRNERREDALLYSQRDISISDSGGSSASEEDWSAADGTSEAENSGDIESQIEFDSDRFAAFDEKIGSDSDDEGASDVEDKLARIVKLVRSQKMKGSGIDIRPDSDHGPEKAKTKPRTKGHTARQVSPIQTSKRLSITASLDQPTSKQEKAPGPSDESASSSEHSVDEIHVPKQIAQAGFLPSLSLGGYMSGSDSDATDVEDQVAPRKNRRGQRARQAIWEMKFKDQARHLKHPKRKQRDKRDEGWDLQKGAVVGDEHQKHGKGEQKNRSMVGGAKPARTKLTASGGNAEPVGRKKDSTSHNGISKPKQRDDEGSLHPSWLAKKQMKQQTSGALSGFKGKKITFD